MRVPTEFVHNRFMVALAATGMLLVAVMAGATSLQIDGKEPIFAPAEFHFGIGVILAVFIAGYAAGAVGLLYPWGHRAGKAALIVLAACVLAMVLIGWCNGHAFVQFYTFRGTRSYY
jgi:hypothetical protein